MLLISKPHIENINFPHHVRGPGIFTPIDIQLNGWGFFSVKYPKIKKSKPFKKFKLFKSEIITLDVPKDESIRIVFWNLLGKNSIEIKSPGNNTNINNIVAPEISRVALPKSEFISQKIKIKPLSTSLLNGLKIYPIRNFGGHLRTNFAILINSYSFFKTKHSIEIQSIQTVQPEHTSHYKLQIDFNRIQISNDEASNIPKGSR